MAQILTGLANTHHFLFVELANPHIKDWFLMATPVPVLLILGAYLWFVKDFGPRYMADRPPFKLDRLVQVYNVFQIGLSFYTFVKIMQYAWWGRYSWRCAPVVFELDDPDEYGVASISHLYFVTKIIDLLDTIFFTLRKKYNQVTFLHLYHHSGMVALTWGGMKWFTTGHGSMIVAINSLVHTILYSYYLVTSLSSKYSNTWWKKYITQIQLAQFLFLTFHFGQLVFHNPCNFPNFGLAVMVPQNLFVLILFADFYYNAYVKTKAPKVANNKTS